MSVNKKEKKNKILEELFIAEKKKKKSRTFTYLKKKKKKIKLKYPKNNIELIV